MPLLIAAQKLCREQRQALKDLAIAISLANLCFLGIWANLLYRVQTSAFLIKTPPPPASYIAAMLNVFLLMLVGWVAIQAARLRLGIWMRPVGLGVLAVMTLIAGNAAHNVTGWPRFVVVKWFFAEAWSTGRLVFYFPFLAIAICALIHWRRYLIPGTANLLLLIAPFAAFTIPRAIWLALSQESASFSDVTMAPMLTDMHRNSPRVIWIVFDEWDQGLTFDRRPAGLEMPEIDRFRRQALYANHASPPASHTLLSLPSLILGKMVIDAKMASADRLDLTFSNGERGWLGPEIATVFSRARDQKVNTAVAGWYLPYCRFYGLPLTQCVWEEIPWYGGSLGHNLPQLVASQWKTIFESAFRSPWGPALVAQTQAKIYGSLLNNSKRYLGDSRLGLVLLHLPVPHGPFFYDRRKRTSHSERMKIGDYLDGLALVDTTLADLRSTMETTGSWDGSAVLLTSDHWYRDAVYRNTQIDHRVPFLLKLPHQTTQVPYNANFNTVVTSDLLMAILSGEITESQQLVAWLDRHREH